ncbi:VOC family protein [Streptomyces sp. NBC_01023]
MQAGGGRKTPWEGEWPRVLADPEGNEFCVV